MPLKKRTLSSAPSPFDRGAAALPSLMASLPNTRVLQSLPTELLQPAPAEWNFYAPLPDGKFIELLDSIQTSGLLHPVVVWKQADNSYLVLSGHNRLRAFRRLFAQTGDPTYATIPATVLTDITREEAREIVIDSNWVQRNLTPSEKAKSIYQKYILAGRKHRSPNGERRSNYDIIAEQYQLSSRQIARYVRLGSLSEELQALVDAERLPIRGALFLVDFPHETQVYLATHYPDRLRGKKLEQLLPDMTTAEIDAVFSKPSETVQITVTVPKKLESRFRRMVNGWLEQNSAAVRDISP